MKKTTERLVIFPGSFDPFTWGHLEIVIRAAKLFDRVLVGVGVSGTKQSLFSADERVHMIKEACSHLPQVEVAAFEGLAAEFAVKRAAVALVRGLRSEADFGYEMPMAFTNRSLAKDLETLFIPTEPKYCYVSSSLVKEVALYGADVSLMVPPSVSRRLTEKLRGR